MNNWKLNFIVDKHILNQNIGTRARFKSSYSKGGQWMSELIIKNRQLRQWNHVSFTWSYDIKIPLK